VEFPALFDDDELERARAEQLAREYARREPYQPFLVVAQHYPRIARAIEQLWGAPEMDRFFDRLLIDERGNRAGFPPEVVQALLLLSSRHQQAFRYHTPADVWISDPTVSRRAAR